jgi:diguanylate cyclase (GGDEF)-like protein/PAS domain S-box-containing protein
MELDTRTLVAVLSLSNALMGLILFWVFRDSQGEGTGLWILSLFMKAAGTGVLLLPPALTSPLLTYAGTMTLTGAYTLNYLALCVFLQVRRNAWLAFGPLAVLGVIAAFRSWIPFSATVSGDLARFFLIAVVVALLMRHEKWYRNSAHNLMVAGFVIGLVVFGGRVVGGFLDPVSFTNFDRSNLGRATTFLIAFTVSIVTSFGMVLMHRHRAMDKLLASENVLREFKAIITSNDDAIISKSLHGVIQSWNSGAEKLFGYTAAEAMGHPMQMLIPAGYLHEEPDILARISRGEKVEHFETVRRHKDGHLIDVATTTSPILDENGQVTGASSISRDISQRKQLEEQVRQLAFHDPLTQLPNRRLLSDRLAQAMRTSKRTGRYGALVFLDLDNFKPLNDRHGHDVGDLLLVEAARRLSASVRESDTVSRFGGDEFVVVLGDLAADEAASTSQARDIADKLRLALAAPYFMTLPREGQADVVIEHHCTASVGVVVFGSQSRCPDELLRLADTAMYQAKEAGRNVIRIHDAHTALPDKGCPHGDSPAMAGVAGTYT